ncbi:MAG: protein kinase [Ruminococcus sp.]|nr:protein kinase [Ruminococcus sp.]
MSECKICSYNSKNNFNVCPICGYSENRAVECDYMLEPGTVLRNGKYAVVNFIGTSPVDRSVVTYNAWDRVDKRVVELNEFFPSDKVYRDRDGNGMISTADEETTVQMNDLRQSVQLMMTVEKTDSLVEYYDCFDENGTLYFTSEKLEGLSLRNYLATNRSTPEFAEELMSKIFSAATALHSKKIVHGNICPDQIFLCLGEQVKLLGLGSSADVRHTQCDEISVNEGFSAPECYTGSGRVTIAQDIYALGALYYMLLVDKVPPAPSERKKFKSPEYPHRLNSRVSQELSCAVMTALALDEKARYKSVEAFMQATQSTKPVKTVEERARRMRILKLSGIYTVMTLLVGGTIITGIMMAARNRVEKVPECKLTLWYKMTDDEEKNERKRYMYTLAADGFMQEFSTVKITVTGIDAGRYEKELNNAKKQPNLFEYDDYSTVNGGQLTLNKVYSSKEAKECMYLKEIKESGDQWEYYLPVGFKVPAIFVNTDLAEDYKDSVKDSRDLLNGYDGAVLTDDSNKFANLLNVKELNGTQDALTIFTDGQEPYLAADTVNYFDCFSKLKTKLRVVSCDNDTIPCETGLALGAFNKSRKENRAAIRFLEYMLSSDGQTSLHISGKSGSIPLNSESFDEYADVFPNYKKFFDNQDSYVFE